MTKENEKRSRRYIFFIVVFMGLVGILDNYLALIEAVTFFYVMEEYDISAAELALWQGIYGILTLLTFLIGWFNDSYGRKKGILLLILVMGIPAFLIGMLYYIFLSFHLFMILYATILIGTISNVWEVPTSEESPPEKRGTYVGIVTLIGLIPMYAFFGVAIAENLGWQWCYGIMFFYMLILLIPLYFMKEPQRWLNVKDNRGDKMLKLKTALKSLTRKDIKYVLLATMVHGIWGI